MSDKAIPESQFDYEHLVAPRVVAPHMVIPPAARHPQFYLLVAKTMLEWVDNYHKGLPHGPADGRLEWRVQVAGLTSMQQPVSNESK